MKRLLLFFLSIFCVLGTYAAVTDLSFTATKKIAGGGEIWYPTATNVSAANGAGWCSNNANGSNNKYGTITPSLSGDNTEEEAFKVDGVVVKGGNIPGDLTTSKKAIVIKVKNTTAITVYGVTTSSSAAAGLQWSIYDTSDNSAVVSSAKGLAAAPNVTATITKDGLSADKTYIVCIEGGYKGDAGEAVGTSTQDVVVYAIKFEAPSSGKASSTFALTSEASVVIAQGETSQISTENNAGNVTYQSSPTSVATVSETGLITAVAPGTASVIVSDPGDDNTEGAELAVSVVVPYAATVADSYLLNTDTYGFSGADNTYYFKNGLSISNPNGKTYGTASLAKSLKYSAGVDYSINIPEGVTIYYAKITARNNYDKGNTAATWGTIFGQDFTSEELPYSSETAVEKTVTLAEPKTGGSLIFTPGGNQVQMVIELFTSAMKAASDLAVASASADVNVEETTDVTYTTSSTGAVSVSSNKPGVATATVDADTKTITITGVCAGTATITLSQEADDTYAEEQQTITVTVINPFAPTAIFTANAVKKDYSVEAGANAVVVSSEYISVDGGTLTVSNGQTAAKNLTSAQGGSNCLVETNGNTFFGVALEEALQAGDVISAQVYTRTDNAIGLCFSTSAEYVNVGAVAEAAAQAAAWVEVSYTVVSEDGLCGENAFNIFRSQGKTTYFKDFTVARAATVATPTLNAKGYGTFSCAKNVQILGAKVYKATLNDTQIVCTKIESGLVPAGTGVLIFNDEATSATAVYVASAPAIEDNGLCATTLADGSLASLESALVLSGDTFMTFTGSEFVAGKAYFPYDGVSSTPRRIVFHEDEVTAIDSVIETKAETKKVFRNGKFLIETVNGTVNAAGVLVK